MEAEVIVSQRNNVERRDIVLKTARGANIEIYLSYHFMNCMAAVLRSLGARDFEPSEEKRQGTHDSAKVGS